MIRIKSHIHRQLSDFTTPVNVLLAVREKYPITLLLESSDYQTKENSFSFIGFNPIANVKVDKGIFTSSLGDNYQLHSSNSRLSVALESFISKFRFTTKDAEIIRFNGLFGYYTFETVKYFDNYKQDIAKKENIIPDLQFHFFSYLIVFDHYNGRLLIIENLEDDTSSKMTDIISLVNKSTKSIHSFNPGVVSSDMTDLDYKQMVTKAKQHCQRGNIFQLVLSRRYSQAYSGDDINVYRALRAINPSPYLFFFDYGNFKIMGSSPEAQIVVRGSRVEVHPIAGTMKRTGDAELDNEVAKRLVNDPKENAEHNMLIDLARNDLSKHCNDIKISKNKIIQYFSHVIHLTSKIVCSKPNYISSFQIFEDTFPAGTLSGAPRYKAIELINEFEPKERSFYGGAIGYVNFNGDMNMAICIRSVLSKNQVLYFQAGAGIVIASEEEKELQEVDNKLKAIQEAIKMAKNL